MVGSLAEFLDHAVAVFDALLAMRDALSTQEPNGTNVHKVPNWSKVEPHFLALGDALLKLQPHVDDPPTDGMEAADWLKEVKQHALSLKQYVTVNGGKAAIDFQTIS